MAQATISHLCSWVGECPDGKHRHGPCAARNEHLVTAQSPGLLVHRRDEHLSLERGEMLGSGGRLQVRELSTFA